MLLASFDASVMSFSILASLTCCLLSSHLRSNSITLSTASSIRSAFTSFTSEFKLVVMTVFAKIARKLQAFKSSLTIAVDISLTLVR